MLVPSTPVAAATSLVSVGTGFDRPLFATNAGDGSGRLFIVEKPGRIRIIDGSGVRATPFLDIRGYVATGDEQGLLGLAFHPSYATNRKFYVYYTTTHGNIAVNEYRASATNPNVADTSPHRRIITIDHPPPTNHNGGMLAFGPDGYLYIGTGDGGSSGDPGNRAQNKESLLGKILRIDINGTLGSRQYRIPKSNPFVGKAGANEVWSYGCAIHGVSRSTVRAAISGWRTSARTGTRRSTARP